MRSGGRFFLGLPTVRRRYFLIGPMSIRLYPRFAEDSDILITSTGQEQDVYLKTNVNWELISKWVSQEVEPQKTQMDVLAYLEDELEDVRVIDVDQSCISYVPPSGTYVALSYVWGKEPSGQFQTMRHNIHSLEQPGSLGHTSLPRTITDAMTACRKLGQRFLWIDRLCIIQDEPLHIKSIQLDQMGAIYRQAKFTIVALAGDGATYGLPGESAASMSLIYFTDFGVYFRSRESDMSRIMTEGPAKPELNFMDGTDDYHYSHLVELYTKRFLSYPVDILRAFTGVLHGLYGLHSFGMPWTALDRAILWEASDFSSGPRSATDTEIFPSWSWASATGSIHFHERSPRGCSVAFLGIPNSGNSCSPSVDIAEPLFYDETRFYSDKQGLGTHMAAALAWLNGCIRTETPQYLSRNELSRPPRSLWKFWPDYITYWHEAFDHYKTIDVFSKSDIEIARKPGHLMIHTQIARFSLYWLGQRGVSPGCNQFLIRASNYTIAGSIYLGQHYAREYKEADGTEAYFIALSTCRFPETRLSSALVDSHFEHIPLGAIYGCPCSTTAKSRFVIIDHFSTCPQNPNFTTPVTFQPSPLPLGGRNRKPSERVLAFSKYLGGLSYVDSNGDLLHPWDDVPGLSVLLIRASEKNESDVYHRIGIGRISLKRWVEAYPVFKTVVLE
ncbi:hypothetical protein N0V90_009503 [Kalmusia sp. IMI 367209]|nr:hypothetical protein N0V90_009503 [Kalmusia sp. IMI 367209]